MHVDHGERVIRAFVDRAAFEQERRPVVQQRAVVGEDLVLVDLCDCVDGHVVANQEADVDRADVVALFEVGRIDNVRIPGRDDCREVLEHAEFFHFLHGEHVGRFQHVDDVGGELGLAALIFLGRDDLVIAVAVGGIVHVVEQAEHVKAADRQLGTCAVTDRRRYRGRVDIQLDRPELVAAELEAHDANRIEGRTRRDDLVVEAELVRVELEDLGVAVPGRNARDTEARVFHAGFTERPLAGRADIDLGNGVGPEALVGPADDPVGDRDEHALVTFVLDRAAGRGRVGRGDRRIERHRRRHVLRAVEDSHGGAIGDLRKAEKFLDGAGHVDQVADQNARRAPGKHEDTVGGVDVAVSAGLRRLHEETVTGNGCHDVGLRLDHEAGVGAGGAVALDLEDLSNQRRRGLEARAHDEVLEYDGLAATVERSSQCYG